MMYAANQMPVVGKVEITRLLLRPSGTWNQQFMRPWELNVTGAAALTALAEAAVSYHGELTPGGVASIARSSLAPTVAAVCEAPIENSWAEERLLFVMEVEIIGKLGGKSRYWFQGYTSYNGVSLQGSIDPNMNFYINSYLGVTVSKTLGGDGMMYEIDTLLESCQVTNGLFYNDMGQQIDPISMRPYDVLAGIQLDYAAQQNILHGGVSPNVNDQRISLLGPLAKTSSRSNTLATSYLSNLAGNYLTASAGQNASERNTIIGGAMAGVSDGNLSSNAFFAMLAGVRQNQMVPLNFFNMNELLCIDPTVNQRTTLARRGDTQSSRYMHMNGQDIEIPYSQAGNSEYWNNLTNETMVATTLSNALPTLAASAMVEIVSFAAYNQAHQWVVAVNGCEGFSRTAITMRMEQFKRRLVDEVLVGIQHRLGDITVPINLNVFFDMFGATRIEVNIGQQPETTVFLTPHFSDSLNSAIIAPHRQHLQNITPTLERALNHMSQTYMSAIATQTGPAMF